VIIKKLIMKIHFLGFLVLYFNGCTLLPCQKENMPPESSVPKEITYKVPKWRFTGNISEKTPTVIHILKRHTGTMGAALALIKSNHWKYTNNYYSNLAFGASVYVSEDGELLIIDRGGKAPDAVIIKRKPNPEYYAIKKPLPSSITEDTLTE
jgi:hypothetical protein